MKRQIVGGLLLAASMAFSAGATAESPVGLWNRDDGLGGVRIAPCGGALCGHIVWLRDKNGPAYLGQKVLYGMQQTGPSVWSGSAVNPSDGRTYAGSLTVEGAHMITRGCALGGMICQSVPMSRPR